MKGCFDQETRNYIVKDCDNITRIIPSKSIVANHKLLASLGTNEEALRYLIEKVKDLDSFSGKLYLIEYDSLRRNTSNINRNDIGGPNDNCGESSLPLNRKTIDDISAEIGVRNSLAVLCILMGISCDVILSEEEFLQKNIQL